MKSGRVGISEVFDGEPLTSVLSPDIAFLNKWFV